MLDQPVRNLPFVPIATQVSNLVDEAVTVCEFGISQVFNPNPNLPRPPSSNIMLQGKGTILGKDTCAKKWGQQVVDKQYVCTIQDIQVSCNVSPLIAIHVKNNRNGLQVGIGSFGEPDCHPQYPDVYTSVAFYAPWIRETVASASVNSLKP